MDVLVQQPRVALVVDDEPVLRALLPRMLEVDGLRAVAVGTREEALALLRDQRCELALALIDAWLRTEDDGLELASAVHAAHPRLPIVVMSGDPGSLDRAALVPGVVATLPKPAGASAVRELARRLVA